MSDNHLIDRLNQLGSDPGDVPDAVVVADLTRGRRARRWQRARRVLTGLGLASIATIGVLAVTTPSDTTPSEAPTAQPAGAPAMQLVAYTDTQPEGFQITSVPEGFVVQGVNEYRLTLAPSGDTSHPDNFVGKVVVMLQSASDPSAPRGEDVQVGDHPGKLRDTGGAWLVAWDDGEHIVHVQASKEIGLTTEQVVEFAGGVTVTADAQQGVG